MEHGPFTQKIASLVPDRWERFVRAVERERGQGELLRSIEKAVETKKDRSAYFRARYKARRAAGLCKLCDNPSGVFVLCIFHRARASRMRQKRKAA